MTQGDEPWVFLLESSMRYLGGKVRICKQIAKFLESKRKPNQEYLEPFLGGASVFCEMSNPRFGSDINTPLITMWKALMAGWVPPDTVSEELYKEYKNSKPMGDPLTAFIGIGCSYSGKWFGGFARDGTGRNYCKNAKNQLLKKKGKLLHSVIRFGCYWEWCPVGMLIYCDPPYEDTTQYDYCKGFDHGKFWDTMRDWSKNNDVYISEYKAPDDFKCVLEIETKTDMHEKSKSIRIERLFSV